jgi:hypothetical protein
LAAAAAVGEDQDEATVTKNDKAKSKKPLSANTVEDKCKDVEGNEDAGKGGCGGSNGDSGDRDDSTGVSN